MVFYATPPVRTVAKAELPPHFVRLNAILDDLEAGFRSAARRAFNSFADGQKLSVIEAALRTGNMGQLMSVIDFRTLALNLGTELGPAMRAAMLKGGEEALKVVPGVVAGAFDLTNPLVVGFARDHSAQLVRELTTNTELGIRAVIGQGMGEGLLPATMARRIRDVNGFKLTRGQTMSVNNFRAGLVQTIQGDMSAAELGRRYQMSRGMLEAKQLRMANVDKLTRQYRERWFRNRAATIARQEASMAYHFGKRMGWMQAIQRGALDPAKDVRQWIATPDERTCFPAFTPVLIRQGERPISEIQPGQSVKTPYGYRRVVATNKREYDGEMVALQTEGRTLLCTSDHPVWVFEKGWLEGADVEVGNHLKTVGDQAAKVLARVRFQLTDVDDRPSLFIERTIPGAVSSCVVPVDAIGFNGDALVQDGEVNGVAPDLALSHEVNAKRLQRFAHRLLQEGFPFESPVAGEAAELPVGVPGKGAEFLAAVPAGDDMRRAPAPLRAMPAVFLPGTEALAAPFTIPVEGVGRSALHGAAGIPLSDHGLDGEGLGTYRADLGDGFGGVPGFVTDPSAEPLADAPLASVGPIDKAAPLTDLGLGADAGEGVIAGRGAEAVLEDGPSALRNELATLIAGVVDEHLAANLIGWLPGYITGRQSVYNLQVEREEVYYASGLLVHNCQICLPMHLQIRGFNEDFTTGDGGSVADAPAHIACRCDTIIITERRQKRRLSRPERRAQERIRALQDARDRAREARGLEPQFVPDPGAFPGDLP